MDFVYGGLRRLAWTLPSHFVRMRGKCTACQKDRLLMQMLVHTGVVTN